MFQAIKQFWPVVLALFMVQTSVLAGGPAKEGEPYNPTPTVMHHISDAHHFNLVGDSYIPLPCIAYSSEQGLFFHMSSDFGPFANHGNGANAVDGYVIFGDQLMRIKDANFPKGIVALQAGPAHGEAPKVEGPEGHQTVTPEGVQGEGEHAPAAHAKTVVYNDTVYELESAASLQHASTWYDFSITKNVFSMLLGFVLLFVIFRSVASAYKKREGHAPKGMQSLMEIVLLFLRDEVLAPSLGKQTDRFAPFLFSMFFFILVNNLLGLIPIFPGSANVTGNLGVTMVLAIIAFIVVNISGNKHYWEHVFWMPGVPAFVKLILTPLEVLGLFIKPITLMLRLFANITAGHIIILSLISLIFVFNSTGQLGGGPGGVAIAIPFVFALNMLELFVAFLQAYVFTLLTTLYIGSAIEEHHHHDEEHAHH